MSYEGYTQILCKKGHCFTPDAYDPDNPGGIFGITEAEWRCPTCQEKLAWTNEVDLTNGSYCESLDCDVDGNWCEYCDEGRIDNYIELELAEEAHYCTCTECGNKHLTQELRYKIPEDKGIKWDL